MDWFWYAFCVVLFAAFVIMVLVGICLALWLNDKEKEREAAEAAACKSLKFKGVSKRQMHRATQAAIRFDRHMARLKKQNMRVKYRSR